MPKKTVAIIVGAVLLVFAAAITFAVINSSNKDATKETEQTTEPDATSPAGDPSGSDTDTPATPPSPDAPVSSEPGRFVDYSEAEVNQTEGRKLLFFYAPWCPQCRALEADINSKGVPNDITIFKVDYDTSQSLRQKYDVTIQTTIVEIDDNGNMISKIVAYDEPTLAFVLNNL